MLQHHKTIWYAPNKFEAYGQEEIDVRMCVVEEFINHMATQGWFFTIETWYAMSKDMVIFKKYA